jgi:hypothetical protein
MGRRGGHRPEPGRRRPDCSGDYPSATAFHAAASAGSARVSRTAPRNAGNFRIASASTQPCGLSSRQFVQHGRAGERKRLRRFR